MLHRQRQNRYRYLILAFLALNIFALSSCEKQAKSTLLLNEPYDDARKMILRSGWKPAKIKRDQYTDLSSISRFLDLGYTEVDACSGNGKGYCRFVFQNDLGLFMEVTTQEAPFVGDRVDKKNWDDAVVIYYGITDKIDK